MAEEQDLRVRGIVTARSILFDQLLEPALALDLPSLSSLESVSASLAPSQSSQLAETLHRHFIESRLPIRNKIVRRVNNDFDLKRLLEEKETKGAWKRARQPVIAKDNVDTLSQVQVVQQLIQREKSLQAECERLSDARLVLQNALSRAARDIA